MPGRALLMFFHGADALFDAPARDQQAHALGGIEHAHFDGQRDRRGDRVAAVHHRVFAEQDDLAVRETAPFAWRGCGVLRDVNVCTSSAAFQTLISPDSINASTTVSNRCSGTPAVVATLRACSVMWPCWMPSVDSARSAAKFCASPTLAMIEASSRASGEPSRR